MTATFAEDGEDEDEDADDELQFIGDGEETIHLADVSEYNPQVMIHSDARDVLRKVVKDKNTAFIVQFYKGSPDRDLREDLKRYVLHPKTSDEYSFSKEYEYTEIDVENPQYADLIDNLSFKKKFEEEDYPYVLYTYGGKGFMVHGPGTAREIFDLRKEVEKATGSGDDK